MGAATIDRKPGDVLEGRYRLLARVGQGGFGDVWRAAELLPDGEVLREVALKLLHAGLAAEQDWSGEARIIASLRHEALVTIYSAGVLQLDEPAPFVAMELLLGESLAEHFERDGRTAWRRVLAWARQAAAALDVIHRAGVVHLDLKPANLFIDRQGGLKVLDFGIARQGNSRPPAVAPAANGGVELSTAAFMVAQQNQPVAQRPAAMVSQTVVGTPGFMAPEVFEGGEATHAADAYALAACMVQLACGTLPQQIDSRPSAASGTKLQAWLLDVQAATVRGRLRDLASEYADMPAALMALWLRWLALDPKARRVERGQLRQQLDEVWHCPHGPRDNPFRGLATYSARDEGTLFGRDGEARRGARDLFDQPCTVLHGPHGAGLRSLVLAAVIPALAKRFADQRDDWLSLSLDASLGLAAMQRRLRAWLDEHGAAPAVELDEPSQAVGAAPTGAAEGAIVDAAPLSREPAARRGGDAQWRRLSCWAEGSNKGLVVVVTRLECAVQASHASWYRECIDTTLVAKAGLRFVGVLRAEHVSAVLETELGQRLRPWLRYVSPPAASAARDMVQGALSARGIRCQDVDTIAEQCQAELFQDGARLPLVSLALHDWFRQAQQQQQWTAALWHQRGGVVGAVIRHADRWLAALAGEQRLAVKRVLLRLVSADGQPLAVDRAVLVAGHEDATQALALLQRARLVVGQQRRVQLSHPRLAQRWTWLNDQRLHDLDRLAFLEQLRSAAAQWIAAGYQTADLWDGRRLASYRQRAERVAAELTSDERRFVWASLAKRRRSMLWRALLAALVLATVGLAVWFDYVVEERGRRYRARMRATQREAALAAMVARSRRSDDPYVRTALLAGAIAQGARDPALPLELLRSSANLVPADFLTLDEVHRPQFFWGQRWLLGAAGSEVLVFDFDPPGGASFAPALQRFRPHQDGLVDVVAMHYGNAFVTRGLDGRLKVWRLKDGDGGIALAAVSPMRCTVGSSQVMVAERAAVIACATAEGMARWDLNQPAQVLRDPFGGRLLDISADGRWLLAARLKRALLWNGSDGRRIQVTLDTAPNVARLSQHNDVAAFVYGGGFTVFEVLSDSVRQVWRGDTLIGDPVAARFSADGLNLAVCEQGGASEWHYLRRGGRAPEDPPPPKRAAPCQPAPQAWPRRLADARMYGEHISQRHLGPRLYAGGWQQQDGTTITRDLVKFSRDRKALTALTQLRAIPREPAAADSVTALLRDGNEQVWQVGGAVRIHSLDGHELLRRPGHLLARCPDGRLLARRKTAAGVIELFGARSDVLVRRFTPLKGFVLGVDPDCTRLFAQRLDGTLVSGLIAGGGEKPQPLVPLAVAAGNQALAGYVYDARPSVRRGGRKAGLWLAYGSGAMVRVDADARVTRFGVAVPRASAMADGPDDDDLLFADETGIVWRRHGVTPDGVASDKAVLPPMRGRRWEDMLPTADPHMMWVSWAHGAGLLDLDRGELLDEVKLPHHGRLSRWSEQGSVASWSYLFMGPPHATIILVGAEAASKLGAAASNLRAALSDDSQSIVLSLHGR